VTLLPYPYRHQLSAAIGWLELGDPDAARAELDALPPAFEEHPHVLQARWQICAELRDWEGALAIARQELAVAGDSIESWIHQAYALRRVPHGGLEKARDALLPACRKFPNEDIVPFNLACYAAQLGQLEEAWDWLLKAMRLGQDGEQVRRRALADEDLKPLWDRLRAL